MRLRTLIVGVAAFVVTALFAHGRVTPYNNYVLLAAALLHGHVWIDWPGEFIDAVLFEGHRYIVNDPVPGVMLVPFVALFGAGANQTLLACALAGVATAAAWRLARNVGVSENDADWLAAFVLLGTDLMWCAMLGDVWYLAHVACIAFLLLALCEVSGANRPGLVAMWFALACGSRFTVILTLPAFAFWIAYGFLEESKRLRALVPALAAFLPFALLWVGYNEVRWHVPWDSGHTIFFHQDVLAGGADGSPFSFANVPYQAWSFFVQTPAFVAAAPFAIPLQTGVALTWTSPALALAFFARQPRRLVISAWLAAILAAGPAFLYYVNGFVQFGMRHALDFEAFLFVLMALAARRGLHVVWYILIAVSCAIGIWGSWYWNTVYRVGN
ncbi:MAG: hypothetical protein NVSMB64_23050 [Candidatus Velthaea sp.]